MDEDAFLPSENDKLKSQIKDLRRRLQDAKTKEKQLRKELIEEDLSYVVVSNLIEMVQDPTQVEKHQLDAMQKEILDKMMKVAHDCCVREIVSYHRLAGRSIFTFNGGRRCIRLETYYKNTYKEPYYIVYNKDNLMEGRLIQLAHPQMIEHHTIPLFIHLEALAKKHLPHNFDTFLRIVHAQIQAYVTKRETFKDIADLGRTRPIKVIYQSNSLHTAHLQLETPSIGKIRIVMLFDDKSSSYPTEVSISKLDGDDEEMSLAEEDYCTNIAMDLKQKSMVQVLRDLVPETESSIE